MDQALGAALPVAMTVSRKVRTMSCSLTPTFTIWLTAVKPASAARQRVRNISISSGVLTLRAKTKRSEIFSHTASGKA